MLRRDLDRGSGQQTPEELAAPVLYDCWQSDQTAWYMVDGVETAIAGNNHSPYLVGLWAELGDGTGEIVRTVFGDGIAECGIPAHGG